MMKNKEGKHTINRWFAIGTFLVVSYAFIKESVTRSLSPWDYLTYPAGVLFCYAPVMAAKLMTSIAVVMDAFAKAKQTVVSTTVAPAEGEN